MSYAFEVKRALRAFRHVADYVCRIEWREPDLEELITLEGHRLVEMLVGTGVLEWDP